LTFLVEEAADQPVCPVLPNTGPKPLRPLLKAHLVTALIRATPKFTFSLDFLSSRASLYNGRKRFRAANRLQAD
jgi:hypothetical protein